MELGFAWNMPYLRCYLRLFIGLCLLLLRYTGEGAPDYTQVHKTTLKLPEFPKISVANLDRFLNDLMLSPLWKVEQTRAGYYIAKARCVSPPDPFSTKEGQFLFENTASITKGTFENQQIYDRYLYGNRKYCSISIYITFTKPDLERMSLGESGRQVPLIIYGFKENKLSSGSLSDLAVRLSSQHEIYLVIHEQGGDENRGTTLAKLLPALQEVEGVINCPSSYRVEDRYAKFFAACFDLPLKDQEIKRFPGLQDRDTFYGYFRVKPGFSYGGINLKIWHPVYCPKEGTRKSDRLEKAEYSGAPYETNDVVFYLIEDNAVYLSGSYYQRFGTFTGKESFPGILEINNSKGVMLLQTTNAFKGWQF